MTTIAFLGDVVGTVGRKAVVRAAPALRTQREVDLLIVNGENERNGSGLSPSGFRELREAGVDAITLGDHCYRDTRIIKTLEHPESHIVRPANMGPRASGKTVVRLERPGCPTTFVMTVLGQRMMPIQVDNPFQAIDDVLGSVRAENAIAIVEIHAETTSERAAVAWYCDKHWTDDSAPVKVVAVVGSHTHVRTDDARLLTNGVAAISDLGMCGGSHGIIGRTIDSSLRAFLDNTPHRLDVAEDRPRVSGVVVQVDRGTRRATSIEVVDQAVEVG